MAKSIQYSPGEKQAYFYFNLINPALSAQRTMLDETHNLLDSWNKDAHALVDSVSLALGVAGANKIGDAVDVVGDAVAKRLLGAAVGETETFVDDMLLLTAQKVVEVKEAIIEGAVLQKIAEEAVSAFIDVVTIGATVSTDRDYYTVWSAETLLTSYYSDVQEGRPLDPITEADVDQLFDSYDLGVWNPFFQDTSAVLQLCVDVMEAVSVEANAVKIDVPLASLSGPTQVLEGSGYDSYAVYTVSMSKPGLAPAEIVYTTVNGSTDHFDYYGSTSGTLTISPGNSSGTISVRISGDSDNEKNETFTLKLTSGTKVKLGAKSIKTTIKNDDSYTIVPNKPVSPPPSAIDTVSRTPTASLSGPATVSEGNSGISYATYTVSLSAAATSDSLITYSTSAGTAISTSDFGGVNGSLTIASGESFGTIKVPVYGDPDPESDETFALTLLSATNAALGSAKAVTTTISNDDYSRPTVPQIKPTVSLAGPSSVVEGNSGTSYATYTVSLSAATNVNAMVVYSTSNGTANSGDYGGSVGTLTIAAGLSSGTIKVPVYGDIEPESAETFVLNLWEATNATLGGGLSVTTTINNDDYSTPAVSSTPTVSSSKPTVSLAGPSSVVEGNSGTSYASYTVSLSAPAASNVQIVYSTRDGQAWSGYDFGKTYGTLTVNSGYSSGIINVPIYGDSIDEFDETFTLELTSATNATLASIRSVKTAIKDDDPTRSAKINTDGVAFEAAMRQSVFDERFESITNLFGQGNRNTFGQAAFSLLE
ncbi:MAG: hypothetical protein HQL39_02810 [Alphaproteobacteria bacterium]|nr:hypothetical protein [Alphaproteobacteria bacterium]